MLYKLAELTGETFAVPQLVLNQLQRGEENLIRVALYILTTRSTDPADIARALRLKSTTAAQRALDFWYGAGLPEHADPAGPGPEAPIRAPRMTSAEVAAASGRDPHIAALVSECQKLFGGVISQGDTNLLVSLYCNDKIPLETLLVAAAYSAQEGHRSAKYIERVVLRWRETGIVTGADAERYLHLLEKRRENEKKVADVLGCDAGLFTSAERRLIAGWFEDFGYDISMVQEAILYAEGKNTVRYINGIFKSWYAKGWRSLRDVRAAAAISGSNVQPAAPAPSPGSQTGPDRMTRRKKPLQFLVEEE